LQQLKRAADDGMLYSLPTEVFAVETEPAAALAWCAQAVAKNRADKGSDSLVLQARGTTFILRHRHSFLLGLALGAVLAFAALESEHLATYKRRR
jgi:hypothetical protein